MILEPLSRIFGDAELDQILSAFIAGKRVQVSGIRAGAKSLYLVLLQKQLRMPVVVLSPTVKQAENYFRDLTFFAGAFGNKESASRVQYLPAHDTEPYQGVSPHPQITVMRMQALWKLKQGEVDLLAVPVETASKQMAPVETFERAVDHVAIGDVRSPGEVAAHLRKFGYREKDLVTSRGEYSARGGILDFYSPAEPLPVRLEFFGNRIESLRAFETNTQRSVNALEEATVLSLRELSLTEKEIERWGNFSEKKWSADFFHEELIDKTEQLLQIGSFEGYEDYASAFFEKPGQLVDYLPRDAVIVWDDAGLIRDNHETLLGQMRKRYEEVHHAWRIALEPEEIYQDTENFAENAAGRYQLFLSDFILEKDPADLIQEYSIQTVRQYNGQVQEIVNELLRLQEMGFTTFCVFSALGKAERLAEILNEYQAPALFFQDLNESIENLSALEKKILICLGELGHGFRDPEAGLALLTEDDLFGESRPVMQTMMKKSAGSFLSDLRDLKISDYVVHVDHGISQFLGLTTMTVDGEEREFLILKFAEDDKLYLPVERLDLVQKYMGASDAAPRLDRLGSNVWQKTKSRAKASLKDMAEKLLQLYAYRRSVKGHAFPADDTFQREFEEAFEFQETAHQLAAIEDVKSDMQTDKPMDRLICGDVGYGKTEVAMRAAFKAVNEGKQVALLAPTTILAFQHFHTLSKRFEMFPVRIEMVSRFKSSSEIKKTLEDVREGKVDILIGTHRLLSKDVHFQDLGLLIVDEEQRFGVSHKEKLKEMKKNVDALTLTATPIPRTLQMALMGFRPMSVIETPPKDRLAIQTNIAKYSEDLIASAIRAELKREGQVYFVHNLVDSIYSIAAMVQRLVPEARVAVAHGQMAEGELEKVMMKFINHEFDVLVSTTIIENGIDIPLVNTLIVNRADRFGLSQLYQLRGRVGRSHRRAYAYFLIPTDMELTPVARKRLAALREFTDLGSGFRLAALDLEIRGAGNLLGGEQHGHIAALGFELYCRMLEQTVKEMQGEESPEDFSTNVNLNIDIRIPENYIPNMNQRLNLYKRIATVASEAHLAHIRDEMIDRFGPVPPQVENLLEYGAVKSKAERLKIKSIDRSDGSLFFQLSENGNIQHEKILAFIRKHPDSALSPAGVLTFRGRTLHEPEVLFQTVKSLLSELE